MTEELKILAEKVDWKDPDSIIEFYEKNDDTFSDFKSLIEEEKIIELINIKCYYVNSLIDKSRFKKAKSFITDIDILNQKIKQNTGLFNKYEEEKDFFLGIIYGRLKNYSESASIFKRLIKIDPENDNYKDWYTEMRTKNVNKKTMILGIIGLILIPLDLIFDIILHVKLSEYVFIVGLFLVFISILFPYVYKFWIRTKIVWK
jgi:tetratricopeptide (TPR) repeat protein